MAEEDRIIEVPPTTLAPQTWNALIDRAVEEDWRYALMDRADGTGLVTFLRPDGGFVLEALAGPELVALLERAAER